MIRLNAFIRVEASNRAEVITLAKELVAQSTKEEGCIGYDIFESSTRPDVLLFCETWKDAAALAVHGKTEHFTTIIAKLQTLCTLKLENFEF